jgi:hypothetical protein
MPVLCRSKHLMLCSAFLKNFSPGVRKGKSCDHVLQSVNVLLQFRYCMVILPLLGSQRSSPAAKLAHARLSRRSRFLRSRAEPLRCVCVLANAFKLAMIALSTKRTANDDSFDDPC